MGFEKAGHHDAEHSSSFDYSLNGHQPIWPDLVVSRECFQSGSCSPSRVDQYGTKALEEKGLLHRFSLHGLNQNEEMSKSEDLYRFSGDRTNKRVEHVVNLDEYEARIKNLEARLAVQIEKLERLIAAQASHESTGNNDNYSNRPTNLARPTDGSHYVFDRNGNGQLMGQNGEHQYNMINCERVWLKDGQTKTEVMSGCSNGSCGSCSSCAPRHRFLR